MRIGFIGMGNMGFAMLKGVSHTFDKSKIVYTDVNRERLEQVKVETGISFVSTNSQLVEMVDLIVLAIKPQYMDKVLDEIAQVVTPNQILLSIAPGITMAHIQEYVGKDQRIVRSMPNTPALVLEGMTAYTFSDAKFNEEEKIFIERFFSSFGKSMLLSENQLDMVVPVSGSSPAYMFMMVEAMADAGVLFGLGRDTAYTLAAQSMLGSAKLLLETKEHPGILKDRVSSPGGTTIEAIKVLEEKGFRSSVIEAMIACYNKTKKL